MAFCYVDEKLVRVTLEGTHLPPPRQPRASLPIEWDEAPSSTTAPSPNARPSYHETPEAGGWIGSTGLLCRR